MKTSKILKLAAVSALFGVSAAQAAVANNPLQPAHFWNAASGNVNATTDSTQISKPTNPLQPTYFQGDAGQKFVGTTSFESSVIANPLHPQFKRN
jgi:hypothetical protein